MTPIEEAKTVEYQIIQNDCFVAGACGLQEEAWREILHYAAQYIEDGPIQIYEVTRKPISYGVIHDAADLAELMGK